MKICPDCRQLKPISDFNRNVARQDGLSFYCSACYRRRGKEGYERRRRALGKKLRSDYPPVPSGMRRCPKCEQVKPLEQWPPSRRTASGYGSECKSCHNSSGMERYFLRAYGLSRAEVEQRRADQGGLCAICLERAAKRLDHDHATGGIRGLLCFNCNGALGQFQDRIDFLESAIDYLDNHRPPSSDPKVLERLTRAMTQPPPATPQQEAARVLLLAGGAANRSMGT